MPLTGEGRNEQGNFIAKGEKGTKWAEYVSFGETNKEVTNETETAGTGKKFKKTAHGLTTGELVVVLELNSKTVLGEEAGGFVVGVPYYVREVSSSEFCLANTKAQAETSEAECVEYTTKITTSTKFAYVKEGSIKERKKTEFSAAANGISEDSKSHEIESEATQTAKWAIYWSAVTSGTQIAVEATTSKSLEKGDIWKLTNGKINQNAFIV